MDYLFRPAVRKDIPLRVLLIGESGDGKTYTGLAVAHHLLALRGEGGRVAVIDSEVKGRGDRARGTAELYAGEHCLCETCRGQGVRFDFDTLLLPEGHQHPDDYMKAMRAAEAAGYRALVVDSITHAWMALLGQVDAHKAQNPRKDPWLIATPIHRALVEAFKTFDGDLVCTVRSKEKIDKSNKLPGGGYASLGQLPEFRKGIEYEFDVALFMSGARGAVVKTRASSLENQVYTKPGQKLALALKEWADEFTDEVAAKDRHQHTENGRPDPSTRRSPDPTPDGRDSSSSTTRKRSEPPASTEPEGRQEAAADQARGGPDDRPTEQARGSRPPNGAGQAEELQQLKASIIGKAKRLPDDRKGKARTRYQKAGDDLGALRDLGQWCDRELDIAAKAEEPPRGPMTEAVGKAADAPSNAPPQGRRRGFKPPQG